MKHEVYLPECYSEINEFQKNFISDRKDKLPKSEKDENEIYPLETGKK